MPKVSYLGLHEFMHRDVYNAHQLRVRRANDDQKRHWWHFASSHAAYQAYADSVLWRYEILSGIIAATFLIKYCSLLGSDLDCYGHVTMIFTPSRETRCLSKLCFPRLKLSLLKPSCVTVKKVAMVAHKIIIYISLSKKNSDFDARCLWPL